MATGLSAFHLIRLLRLLIHASYNCKLQLNAKIKELNLISRNTPNWFFNKLSYLIFYEPREIKRVKERNGFLETVGFKNQFYIVVHSIISFCSIVFELFYYIFDCVSICILFLLSWNSWSYLLLIIINSFHDLPFLDIIIYYFFS